MEVGYDKDENESVYNHNKILHCYFWGSGGRDYGRFQNAIEKTDSR